MTLLRRAMAISCGAMMVVAVGCGDGTASVTLVARCSDDFACPFDQSCEPSAGVCVPGIGEDNHVSGRLECQVQKLADAAVVELGVVRLSGALDGKKIEFSIGAKCIDYGEGATHIAILGRSFEAPLAGALTIATGSWSNDEVTIEPLITYADDALHPFFYVNKKAAGDVDEGVAAYGKHGTVTFVRTPTADDPTLAFTLTVELAPTKPVPTCSGALCETQADCGEVPGGEEGFTFPTCVESASKSVRYCQHFCRKDADCKPSGGTCNGGLCFKPWCRDQPIPAECAGAKANGCDFCCDLKTNGAGTNYYFGELYPKCGCALNAPCADECKKTCTDGFTEDPGDSCPTCILGEPAKACRTAVQDACQADKACKAYFACADNCE